MLKFIFRKSYVNAMAQAIHEMACLAHHIHETTGASLLSTFEHNPLVTKHIRPDPEDSDQVHHLWLKSEDQMIEIMVYTPLDQARPWVLFQPGNYFLGATIQSTAKGRYLVRLDKPLTRSQGWLAGALVTKFVSDFNALDTNYP